MWRVGILTASTKGARGERKDESGASWKPGKFLHPHDACFDSAGNIFVAEWVHTGRITKLRKLASKQLSGIWTVSNG